MTAKTKSIAIIIGTLLVGGIIGALATGAVFSQRIEELQALRADNGITHYLWRVIEPVDEEQRKQIDTILKETASRQFAFRKALVQEHREIFVDLKRQLGEILTEEQRAHLADWMEKEAKRRRNFRPPGEFQRREGPPPFRRWRTPEDSLKRKEFMKRRKMMQQDSVAADQQKTPTNR